MPAFPLIPRQQLIKHVALLLSTRKRVLINHVFLSKLQPLGKVCVTNPIFCSHYRNVDFNFSELWYLFSSSSKGIKAAEVLEKEGITCNLTLIFSKAQAIACAEAGCTLISPFVGRIMDWYKNHDKVQGYEPSEDPGVKSVSEIYNYFKKFGYKTIVMGASFRNKGEILELAGCDRLTISPQLLEELSSCHDTVEKKLDETVSKHLDLHKIDMNEATFRWMMNEDAMATEKLAEGIRNFAADIFKLETIIKKKVHTH